MTIRTFGAEAISAATSSTATPAWVTFALPLLAVVLSPLTAWLTFKFVKKRELAESLRIEIQKLELVKKPELATTLRNELEREAQVAALTEAGKRRERVRQEVLRWANPILAAVDGLRYRLANILNEAGYMALDPSWKGRQNWSMSYDYFMNSSLYLFATYFGYVELLRQSVNFELFESAYEKDEFFNGVQKVSSSLSAFPAPWPCEGSDVQVFRLQQQALGELMISGLPDHPRCLTYPNFLNRLQDEDFKLHLDPLRELLNSVAPQPTDCRWQRLEVALDALTSLAGTCRRLLTVKP
jgi:hypothetical protein